VLKKDVLHMFCTGIQNFKSIMMGQILGQTWYLLIALAELIKFFNHLYFKPTKLSKIKELF
jgi:hypothetical protein